MYGENRGGATLRKFGIKYARMHPKAEEVRQAFVAVANRNDWQAVLRRWYAEDLPGCAADNDAELAGCAADECG